MGLSIPGISRQDPASEWHANKNLIFTLIFLFVSSLGVFIWGYIQLIETLSNLIKYYALTAILFVALIISTISMNAILSKFFIAGKKRLNKIMISIFMGITALHVFLISWTLHAPRLYYNSSDLFSYSEFLKAMQIGAIPFIDFYFPYPPGMAMIYYLMAKVGIVSPFEIRTFFGLISTINVALFYFMMNGHGTSRKLTSTYFFALFPLYLVEIVGNGHNDVILVTLVLLAIITFNKKRYTTSSLFLLLSFYVKPFTLMIIPIFIVYGIIFNVQDKHGHDRDLHALSRGITSRFWTSPLFRILAPWIFGFFIPLCSAMIMYPNLVMSLFFSQMSRGNIDGFFARVAIFEVQLVYCMPVYIAFLSSLFYLLYRHIKRNLIGLSAVYQSRYRAIQFLLLVPIVAVIIPESIPISMFFLFFILLLSIISIRDLKTRWEITRTIVRSLAYIIIFGGAGFFLQPITMQFSANTCFFLPFVFRNQDYTHHAVIVNFIGGSIQILSGIFLARYCSAITDSDWKANEKHEYAFISIVAGLLFTLSQTLYYPWYLLWYIPILLMKVNKPQTRIKLAITLFLFSFAYNYPLNNFHLASTDYEPIFLDRFQTSTSWNVSTGVSTPGVIDPSFSGDGLTISINWTGYPDIGDVVLNLNKTIPLIAWEPNMYFLLEFSNMYYQTFDIIIYFEAVLSNGSIVALRARNYPSWLFWNVNEGAFLLFQISRYFNLEQRSMAGEGSYLNNCVGTVEFKQLCSIGIKFNAFEVVSDPVGIQHAEYQIKIASVGIVRLARGL